MVFGKSSEITHHVYQKILWPRIVWKSTVLLKIKCTADKAEFSMPFMVVHHRSIVELSRTYIQRIISIW